MTCYPFWFWRFAPRKIPTPRRQRLLFSVTDTSKSGPAVHQAAKLIALRTLRLRTQGKSNLPLKVVLLLRPIEHQIYIFRKFNSLRDNPKWSHTGSSLKQLWLQRTLKLRLVWALLRGTESMHLGTICNRPFGGCANSTSNADEFFYKLHTLR